MAEATAELTLGLSRQIRAEQAAFREVVGHRFAAVEPDMREVKQTLRGLTYRMATFTGRFEDVGSRVRVVEQR